MQKLNISSLAFFALALPLGLIACDESKSPSSSYSLSFTSLEDGATLGCAQDQERATRDTIERDVSIFVEAPEAERPDLVVSLSFEPSAIETERSTISSSGRATFSEVPFSSGAYTLTASLSQGETVRAETSIQVSVEIDPNDVRCGVAESALVFVSPVDGQRVGIADDLDQDLTNGLQLAAEVEIEGPIVNDLVEIQVDGISQLRETASGGRARFESVTLPLEGSVNLTAIAQGPSGLIETSISLEIDAPQCGLILTPTPQEGCDIGASLDTDLDQPGIQAELMAESTCAQVTWTINGQTFPPIDVVDGQARLIAQLNEGENTVSATAQSENGLSAEVSTYVLDVNTLQPTVTIESVDELGVNRFTLAEAVSVDESGVLPIGQWTLTGFTSDLTEGGQVTLLTDPPIPNAPMQVEVDDEGRFTFDLTGTYECGQQLSAQVSDPCGGVFTSPSYTLCLDAITPMIEITSPEEGALLSGSRDLDLDTEGLQTTFTIGVTDLRDVDYQIEVECAITSEGVYSIFSDAPIAQSDLSAIEGQLRREGELTVTFPRAERYTCRPAAVTDGNPAIFKDFNIRVITDEPTFEVLDPSPLADENSCISDQLFIGGQGIRLSETASVINFVIRNESGGIARQGALNALGDAYFGVEVPLGPQGLSDGRYTLEFNGVSGDIPISVIPLEPLLVLIDQTPPALGLLSPQSETIGIEEDLNADLSDCVQTPIEISLNDESADVVCYRLNDGFSQCDSVNALGILETDTLNFLPGENQLNLSVLDCTGETQEISLTLTTQGCTSPLRLTAPLNGKTLSADDDEDVNRDGWQVTATVSGDADETVTIDVSGEMVDLNFGPVTLDASGAGTLVLDLPTPSETGVILTLQPMSDERSGLSQHLSLLAEIPSLTVRPLLPEGECLNQTFADTSALVGFQQSFVADGVGVSSVSSSTLIIECLSTDEGEGEVWVEISRSQGQSSIDPNVSTASIIRFPPSTLQESGQCRARVEARSQSGGVLSDEVSFLIDRVAPQVTVVSPIAEQILSLLDDQDLQTVGIQFSTSLEICGAALQSATISTAPEQEDGPVTLDVEEGECAVVDAGVLTYQEGSQSLQVNVADACGNVADFSQVIIGDTGVALTINQPDDQSLISSALDEDQERLGCQVEFIGISTGFVSVEGIEFAACVSNQSGEPSPLCGNQVDGANGQCESADSEGRLIRCSINLSDGEHELKLVSRQRGTLIESEPVAVYADCSPPSVTEVIIVEDLDDNGCLHRQERSNIDSNSPNATFNVRVTVEGIDDGTTVNLKALPGERVISQTRINQGRGVFVGANLAPGDHDLYLSGLDRALNPLPLINTEAFMTHRLSVDTTPPEPTLLNLTADQCLGVIDDLDETLSGIQIIPELITGVDEGEEAILILRVDNVVTQQQISVAGITSFDVQPLPEGDHTLTVTVTDACGNIGSVSGFENESGRPAWDAPISVPIRVDLQTPLLSVVGLVEGQTLAPNEDANQNSADGFQYDLTLNTAGFEVGQEIRVYSGNQRLRTSPAQLFVTQANTEALVVRVTLPPGPHSINAQGADLCDNEVTSLNTNIVVDIQGCSSELTSIANDQVLGPNQGAVIENGLRLGFEGRVDLLDPTCVDASVELLEEREGAESLLGSAPISDDGTVSFPEITLREGSAELSLRVRLDGSTTDSLSKAVSVDLTAPTISISRPGADAEGVRLVIIDDDLSTPGQQLNVIAQVSEPEVITPRVARLIINNVLIRENIVLEDETLVELLINGLNVPAGTSQFNLCVADTAANEGCFSFEVVADPSAPGAFTITPVVINRRSTEVRVDFIAPGDDGAGGSPVQSYDARWSSTPITEENWEIAQSIGSLEPTALPGALEQFTITDLPPNEEVYLAIRAIDDANRMSSLRPSLVDLKLSSTTFEFRPSANAVWGAPVLDGTASNPLHSIGDFNGDTYPDLLVAGGQSTGIGAAMVILGASDLSTSSPLLLSTPLIFFGGSSAALGDVNGDGAPDVGVLGYTSTFSGAAIAIYLGCTESQQCDTNQLSSPDVIIEFPGVLRSFISGVGDVSDVQNPNCDDLLVGGGQNLAIYTDPRGPTLVEGRSTWGQSDPSDPSTILTIDASRPSRAAGFYHLNVDLDNAGAFSTGLGDLDQDGFDDLAFSTGGNFDQTFIVYGGQALIEGLNRDDTTALDEAEADLLNGTWNRTQDDTHFLELTNPCAQFGTSSFGSYLKGGSDLNGDLVPDFIVGNYSNKALMVIDQDLGLIDCFTRSEDRFGVYYDLVGDINNDGAMDMIVTHQDQVANDALVMYNNGAGIFGADQAESNRAPSMRVMTPDVLKLGVSAAGNINQDQEGLDDFAVLYYDSVTQLFNVKIFY